MLFKKSLWVLLCVVLTLNLVTISTISAQQSSTEDILTDLGGEPCPDSDFTCVTLTVPLNHFDAKDERTIDVVFGMLPATGERKGMFITATGGPGSSGLASADSYVGTFDASVTEHFDIVFFDQRGAYQSGNLQCTNAALTYYETDSDANTPEGEAALIASAQKFADDCVAEMGVPADTLAFYGTDQAVEDLDAFREAIGDEKLWLYGESYGTQYAQTYAAAHPDHLGGLILDGTVDLTLTGPEFLKQQAQAFNDVLEMTLAACADDETCASDFTGSTPLELYDDMAAELQDGPIIFQFPLASGVTVERTFSIADLESAAASFIYSEGGRQILQRALAAATRGDVVPLARLAYNALVIDPETLQPIIDPSFSDALYYAVECDDYNYYSGTGAERAQAYIDAGNATDKSIPHLSSVFYGDLPCAFWPGNPPEERPAPLKAKGIPVLVLGATADPATPVGNGISVYKNLDDGYLVTTQGGAHVIFGRGDECPDSIVTEYLVNDAVPEQRETECEGVVSRTYHPLPPLDAADFADPLEALDSVYTEIYYLPEYYYWDLESLTLVGCPQGGALAFAPSADGEQFRLSNCAFSKGFVLSGTATYNYDSGDFTFDVLVSGNAEGHLIYVQDADGNLSVTGTYDGEDVDLSG